MQQSKVSIIKDQVIEKIMFAIGIFILVMFGATTIYCISSGTGGFVLGMCLFFDVIGAVLVIISRKNKKLIKDFKEYVAWLSRSRTKSIDELADHVGKPSNVVKKNIEKMIGKSYFLNAYIDGKKNTIVFGSQQTVEEEESVEYISKKCNACSGISNVVKGKNSACTYCGIPLD